MITTIKHRNITWINLDAPSSKDVSSLTEQFPLHPLIAEELISPTLRPKVDVYKNSIYLILHFPVYNPLSQTCESCEIDFVIGKNFLITAQYGRLWPLEEFIKEAQAQEKFRKKYFEKHAGYLLFYVLKDLYEFSLRQLDHIVVKINKIEEQIFQDDEKEMVKQISVIKRDVLDFRRTLYPHETVLMSFEKTGKDFFGKSFIPYLSAIIGEHAKVKNFMEGNKETIEALQDTHESLITTKTNQVMKTLTIMAFATFPLMLFSGLFSMNAIHTPIVGVRGDFWIIVFIMVLVTVGMFTYFKRKKWL